VKVVDVRTHVLLAPGFDVEATSSAQDTVVVEVVTDEGIVGVGETDLNAWIARACIEAPGTHTMDRGLRAPAPTCIRVSSVRMSGSRRLSLLSAEPSVQR